MSGVAARALGPCSPAVLIAGVSRDFTGAPPGTRTPNPRIKSLSGASSPGFIRVRAAAQIACLYSCELRRTGVNCNPNCNPATPRGSESAEPPFGHHGPGEPDDLCVGELRPGRQRLALLVTVTVGDPRPPDRVFGVAPGREPL